MSSAIDIINDNVVVTEKTLDDIYIVLYDIYNRFDDFNAMFDELYKALIIIIVMLGVIAGACIFRHMRK